MFKERVPVVLTIPLHIELNRGLLRSQIRKSRLTVKQFVKLQYADKSGGGIQNQQHKHHPRNGYNPGSFRALFL
jgi:hypothetical protein